MAVRIYQALVFPLEKIQLLTYLVGDEGALFGVIGTSDRKNGD